LTAGQREEQRKQDRREGDVPWLSRANDSCFSHGNGSISISAGQGPNAVPGISVGPHDTPFRCCVAGGFEWYPCQRPVQREYAWTLRQLAALCGRRLRQTGASLRSVGSQAGTRPRTVAVQDIAQPTDRSVAECAVSEQTCLTEGLPWRATRRGSMKTRRWDQSCTFGASHSDDVDPASTKATNRDDMAGSPDRVRRNGSHIEGYE
jgi:hypothetical protein